MAALPPVAGGLVAWPFWRQGQTLFGNIVGTVVIFGAALGLIFREFAEIDALVQGCVEAGAPCWPTPSAFTRYAIYASLGLIEVCALFAVSLVVEQRMRDRAYAPEWRRR
jgi:hypothetical protein